MRFGPRRLNRASRLASVISTDDMRRAVVSCITACGHRRARLARRRLAQPRAILMRLPDREQMAGWRRPGTVTKVPPVGRLWAFRSGRCSLPPNWRAVQYPSSASPSPEAIMQRRTLDILLSVGGLVLAGLLLVIGIVF